VQATLQNDTPDKFVNDLGKIGGEPLHESGFETESPEPDFNEKAS
jgi:hypothetical protein